MADLICQPCSQECSSCTGPLNTDCQSCANAFTTSTTNGPVTQCLSSCSLATDQSLCQTCNPQCSGCTGPSNQLCLMCSQDSILLSGTLTCVPRCEGGNYLERVAGTASEYNCAMCHEQCLNCIGPGNTNCVRCLNANSTTNGVSTCLQSCPSDAYESDTGLCQLCHLQCSGGCAGPSNTECLSCLEATVQTEGGGTECTPFCPFGREYNSASDSCELTL